MKLTTTTFVSVDGVMQGIGGPDEDRGGGSEYPVRDQARPGAPGARFGPRIR